MLKAIEIREAAGRTATIARYNTCESADGGWYVYMFDEHGSDDAPIRPDIEVQNLKDDIGADITGCRFGDSILAATELGHWVDCIYETRSPAT